MRTVSKPPEKRDSLAKVPETQLFLTLDDELRDARRVHSYGQEEDLRQALEMVINRVVELVGCLDASGAVRRADLAIPVLDVEGGI